MAGDTGIDVPTELTLEEAIKYAKKNIANISFPHTGEYIEDSDEFDEENCYFENEDE